MQWLAGGDTPASRTVTRQADPNDWTLATRTIHLRVFAYSPNQVQSFQCPPQGSRRTRNMAFGTSVSPLIRLRPGMTVPDSGIYESSHSFRRSTMVLGEPAPPTPLPGEWWTQIIKTNPATDGQSTLADFGRRALSQRLTRTHPRTKLG